MPLRCRHAHPSDLDTMLAMCDHSRQLMRASGNLEQWVGYPTAAHLLADIEAGHSYLLTLDRHPVATFALVLGPDPHYAHIDHGQWIDPFTPYATLHRIAKAPQADGLRVAHHIIAYAKAHYPHLRIDTHPSNQPMLHIVSEHDFLACGTVYMDDLTPRLAYEWQQWDEVDPHLRRYATTHLLPRYAHFDPAHRRDHALRVVARAMVLYRQLSTLVPFTSIGSPNCIYIAAICHDLGLAEGRDHHHTASAHFIRHHQVFRRWLTPYEIELAAQAAEDHRASAPLPPRSLAGCIVAEADRDITPTRVVARTIAYSLHHYPSLDRQGHYQRTLQHLNEKYALGGYIRLWIPQSPNAAPLAELRALIADTPRLLALFNQLFDQLASPSSLAST